MIMSPYRLSMDCPWRIENVARPAGLEPATPGLEGEIRADKLSSHQQLTQGAMPGCHAVPRFARVEHASRNILPDMLRQHLVDEGLVTDLSSPRLFAVPLQDVRIHADRNQPSRAGTYGWAAHPMHASKLLV